MYKTILSLLFFVQSCYCWGGQCTVTGTSGILHDPLYALLQLSPSCPRDVLSFRASLADNGLTTTTAMVANRGYHNPGLGSFSIFESVTGDLLLDGSVKPGEFFFGYFTKLDNKTLIIDQKPDKRALLIEVIAWDKRKHLFNYYELRGNGRQGKWYYRGDSADIFADNKYLHRTDAQQPAKFGKRLRCSGCHGNGGPIMKELSEPFNDWWTNERPLQFGDVRIEEQLQSILTNLSSANNFAVDVRKGIAHLLEIPLPVRAQLSLQERLRPLFCPVEINLVAEQTPNEQNADISIPTEFFIDPLLSKTTLSWRYPRAYYDQELATTGTHFPETNLLDADHPWLTPVKSEADHLAITQLISEGLIDRKFAVDVLSLDFSNPTFSAIRCSLLQLIPEYGPNWQHRFMNHLRRSSLPGAENLLKKLEDSDSIKKSEYAIKEYFAHCQENLKYDYQLSYLFRIMLQRRQELRESQISKNPLGQILEPSFRVIFPTHKITVGNIFLGEDCNIFLTRANGAQKISLVFLQSAGQDHSILN